jgi:predicted Zn-dependent peptidase
LREEKVSAAELERTKNQLKGGLLLGLESTSSRMNRLANMEIYLGRYYALSDVVEGIERVTSEDMQALARELFEMDKLTLTVIRPSQEGGEEEE